MTGGVDWQGCNSSESLAGALLRGLGACPALQRLRVVCSGIFTREPQEKGPPACSSSGIDCEAGFAASARCLAAVGLLPGLTSLEWGLGWNWEALCSALQPPRGRLAALSSLTLHGRACRTDKALLRLAACLPSLVQLRMPDTTCSAEALVGMLRQLPGLQQAAFRTCDLQLERWLQLVQGAPSHLALRLLQLRVLPDSQVLEVLLGYLPSLERLEAKEFGLMMASAEYADHAPHARSICAKHQLLMARHTATHACSPRPTLALETKGLTSEALQALERPLPLVRTLIVDGDWLGEPEQLTAMMRQRLPSLQCVVATAAELTGPQLLALVAGAPNLTQLVLGTVEPPTPSLRYRMHTDAGGRIGPSRPVSPADVRAAARLLSQQAAAVEDSCRAPQGPGGGGNNGPAARTMDFFM